MAHTTATPQIPHHVTALLSHLTSRPGVQSTFILSRRDGSIIQSTGLLASKPVGISSPTLSQTGPTTEEQSESTTPPADSSSPPTPSSATTPNRQTSYQPSQAEALAAHIFAFVSSASDLSLSLSRPPIENTHGSKTESNGAQEGFGDGPLREDGEGETSDKEDDDEVKLLRLRTKKHEIVVVPDRKYLLCVVHDAAHSAGNPSAGMRSRCVKSHSIMDYSSSSYTLNVQLGATYKTSKLSTAEFPNGYKAAAKFINATPEELLHNLSTALEFQPGDGLILSRLNHANSSLKWWSAVDSQSPVCDPKVLKPLISAKTRLVACPHASNILGYIVDVKAIAKIVHHYPRAFSWYKVYGPHIAQLYASSRIHDQIDSLGHFFKGTETLDLKPNFASASYEATQNILRVNITAQEERLQKIVLDFLNSNDRVTVYGERSADRNLRVPLPVPIISFTVRGAESQKLVDEVERRSAYGFRSGHIYSHRLIKDVIDLENVEDGVVRISMLHYNTGESFLGVSSTLAVLTECCRG
ncbi:pyridoxal phosphate-dependent transferase [Aspergillus leporis]|uniref:Pyridoxal phosphate-dependent transferase n=1 Tax=Aspergillus leporis TaxID=41062 RepID=A0A5N5WVG3_9EURO|nr:pyridoxal phosphate-dependent transferase [Aspergillus leporis]